MEKRKETASRISAFMAGAGLVSLIVTLGLVWRPARGKLAAILSPQPSTPTAPVPAADSSGRKILYYQDPMHPWYKSDKPGIAPDCGMPLVPIYASERGASNAPSPPMQAPPAERGPVQLSVAQERLIGLKTAVAEYRSLEKSIRAEARVDVNETRIGQVHTRTSGWIQKVFVDYTTQQVRQGDPLFTIYSPEVAATEREYLLALKGRLSLGSSSFKEVAAGADALVDAARQRLSQWDLSQEQINQIERTGQAERDITLFSPLDGIVTERKAYPNQYVTPDVSLYTIVDYRQVWVYAQIYEPEIEFVRVGDSAVFTTEAYPGRTFRGRIIYIWPQVDLQTRTLKVRMDFPNSSLALKPDMFGNVELHIPLGSRLTVPNSAVLNSGTQQWVFVLQGPGTLHPREVKFGVQTEDYTEIRAGLKPGEIVASSANFLIDSESQLKAALSGVTLGTGVTGIAAALGTTTGGAPPLPQLQITLQTQPRPPKTGSNQVNVTLQDAAGKPVDNAQVRVVFFMPAMPSMNMPAMRSEAVLKSLGPGAYGGEIKVQSPGTWQVSVEVEKEGKPIGGSQFSLTAE